jgi:hypothetical protein
MSFHSFCHISTRTQDFFANSGYNFADRARIWALLHLQALHMRASAHLRHAGDVFPVQHRGLLLARHVVSARRASQMRRQAD